MNIIMKMNRSSWTERMILPTHAKQTDLSRPEIACHIKTIQDEKKPKSHSKLEPTSRDPNIRRSDTEMIKIVKEIQTGLISIKADCFKYGLCRNTLKLFITKLSMRTLGDEFSNQIFSRMNDNQKESALNKKIQELIKDLEYAKL